jgi:soluble lytic murein transglycosylase-like protein
MKRSPSYARVWRRKLPRTAAPVRLRPLVLLAAGFVLAAALPAAADQQRDPELQSVVARAIAQAECFTDQYDSAVWYTLMEPRLRPLVKEKRERLDILQQVYCETHRAGEARLPPGLVMALIAVESRFDRWAVSSAGAVGLMQVMPFWPEKLGMRRYELVHVAPNIHMGCAILRFYLGYEHNDVRKALARYNGSPGKRDYPDLVITQWTRWRGADDLGFPSLHSVNGHPGGSTPPRP